MKNANNYAFEMLNITKMFPGIIANDNITLRVEKGEIHALLGENGAGKSTLMSVLFGLYTPEHGEIKIDGKTVDIKNPNIATELGIGMVHQHFKLVEVFTVLDNIILGNEPTKGLFIDKKTARKKIQALSDRYKLAIDLDKKISDISVGMQQRVEILKMLYRENEIMIFDEPTAVLTPQEITELMVIMRNFASEGKSIVFITHKLNEIKAVADTCSILRKGKYMGCVNVKETSKEELSRLMVGRNVNFNVEKKPSTPGDSILKIRNLSIKGETKDVVNDVSFDVKEGEIVCLAGIEGNGQTDFIYGLTGLEKISSGKINFLGKDIENLSVHERNKMGLAHIPEDRHKFGLVLDYSIEDNFVIKELNNRQFSHFGFLNRVNIREHANKLIDKFDVRSGRGPATPTRSMSGGNQQKAIIAREIDSNPKLLVAVQPTRGLDVGAIEYIHKQIVSERDNGAGVLLVSLELDEVLALSDRILVMYEGEIVGELDPKSVTVEELGLYMAGAKNNYKFKEEK